jgi:LPXTG-site transpeptidase (sortase) family protein
MTPDLTSRPASRAIRGPARFIAALALVAATAACGSADNEVTAPAPTSAVPASPSPTSSTTGSPEAPKVSRRPTAIQKTGGIELEAPYTLSIPRIGVNAPVVPIQSNKERVLEPPRDPTVAGWWSDGAAPGESNGSAVVVGHTVRNEGRGVFDNIKNLSRGDAIKVEGADSTMTYRVQSMDVLSKDEVARNAAEIFAQNGAGRLVLITCDDWDGTAWRSNVVTIAAPV